MNHEVLVAIAVLAMLPGLAGVLLPVLPGIPYMFLIALGFGAVDRFQHVQGRELGILFGLALISLAVDYGAGMLGSKLGGASAKAAAAGFIGLVIGTILLPPLGGFIGGFLGVLYVELKGGNLAQALRAASGSLMGSLVGIGLNLFLGITFLIAFVLMALR